MKRLYWCIALFIFGMVLGTLVAPPIIGSMKPLANGTTTLTWDGPKKVTTEIEVDGAKKDAHVTVRGQGREFTDEISRYTAETSRGLVFLFPYGPDRRSFRFYDPVTETQGTVDYVGPGEVADLRTYVFHGTLDGQERTFEVERKTGTLLRATWETAEGTYTLDSATEQSLIDAATHKTRILKLLQILTWLGKFIAFIAAVTGVVFFVRR